MKLFCFCANKVIIPCISLAAEIFLDQEGIDNVHIASHEIVEIELLRYEF